MRALLRLLPLLIILIGCSASPTRPPQADDATQAYARGDYTAAAREYQKLAERGPAAQRDASRLKAADAWLKAGQPERAREQLRLIEKERLPVELAGERQLLQARVAIEENQIDNALRLLARPQGRDSDPAYMAELFRLRGDAYGRRNHPLDSARAYVHREDFLRDEGEILRNQESVWQALFQLPPNELRSRRTQPAPDVMSGWMELVYIAKQVQTPEITEPLLRDWRRDYPKHPARDELIRSLIGPTAGRPTQAAGAQPPTRGGTVAVLLPLTGRFSTAAEAVRDGIMAAYYETGPSLGKQVRVYDIGETGSQTLAAYDQALLEGAQVVIGPLNKEGAAALGRRGQYPVPTLMLNYADTPVSENLFQFSLAPDDEARRVAEFAARQGLGRAAVLTPNTESGERLRQGFQERWAELGGEVVAGGTFSPTENNYSDAIVQLLGSDGGKRDGGRQPRENIQFIFVVASPREGRQIRPLLKYHYAGHLPTLATSQIYSGRPQPRLDGDLDGIIFEEMPWVLNAPGSNVALRTQLGREGKHQEPELTRLTAFGVDAYNLAPKLRLLAQNAGERQPGETGTLSVDSRHRVVREPVWAQFRRGEPQLLGDGPLNPPTGGQ